ncbi:hypothetical protein CesoFtcFv8_019498 [Champsocephalus esox]|uniref:Uncharacterized protein n=1 Tax=Champsocephalus esox TaxID=159716 RepID=A0AAN8BDG5_9TELE|nr:hypothetical protein CesoFtcFv8_019498 [Champsocephalus esox]
MTLSSVPSREEEVEDWNKWKVSHMLKLRPRSGAAMLFDMSHLKMCRVMIFCGALYAVLIPCSGNSTATVVVRFSVPEDHHICLQCGGSDSSDVVWTHRDRKVLVSRQGSYETNKDPQRYHLLSDGGLCLLRLDDSDGGGLQL